MPTLNVYLYFSGDCENAFDFYRSVFKREFNFIGRYKDVPAEVRKNFPNCTDEQIMHVALPIGKETTLMGADIIDSQGKVNGPRQGFSLYVSAGDKEEADRLFNALSDDGNVVVPIAQQFWGSYYGLCVDKFGINWKITFNAE